MKVCHVINSLNRGGAESHLLELIKAQLDKDISVTVLVIGKDNSEIFSIENNIVELNVPIFRLKGPRMFNLSSYFKMYYYLISSSFDIVHSHQPRSDFMVGFLKEKLVKRGVNFKWIVSIHGKHDTYLPNSSTKNLKLLFFKLVKKFWKKADEIIVISEEVKNWFENLNLDKKPNVISYWMSKKNINNLTTKVPTFGYLGRINQNKGIEDLLEVFNSIENEYELKIGGVGEESYVNKIKKNINQSQNKKIEFLGYVENQDKFFQKIDFFVFPSYSEGLGLVLLEAMSYQKICITRNVPPMNTFINNHSGYLFSDNNELSDVIKMSIQNYNNSEFYKMKIKEMTKVLDRYDLQNLFPKLLELYKK